jgi:hypothetical protein
MTTALLDPNVLRSARGFIVADARGRVIGRVEEAVVGAETNGAARLTVRGRFPRRRRHVVPLTAIEEVDTTSGVISLRVERDALRPR